MGLLRSPDGTIVNLPDEQVSGALASGYTSVSLGQAADTTTAAPVEDTGVTGAAGAGASSLLSGATLGASDLALKHLLPPSGYKQLATDREDHPWISGAGQLVGTVAPSLLTGGTLTPAGYLSSVTAEAAEGGLASGLGAAGIEGAIQNAGAYLSDAALGDRDTTAQGMVGALGTGFAFGSGGGLAAHGVEAGTIAARRMFSRVMDGGAEAAQDAAAAWRSTSQEVLDAHEQTAEIARAKLAAARTAREQAGIARDASTAGVAEAKLGAPAVDAAHAQAAGLDDAIGKVGAQEAAVGGYTASGDRVPRDLASFAERAANPTDPTAPSGSNVPLMMTNRMRRSLSDLGHSADEIANMTPAQAWEVINRPPPVPTEADITSLHDLAQKVDAYTAARREFDEMIARVEPDPDLEAAVGHLEPPDQIQGAESEAVGGVPRGEFGDPSKGGFKTQGELGRLAAERGDELVAPTPDEQIEATRAGRPPRTQSDDLARSQFADLKDRVALNPETAPISSLREERDRINAEVKDHFARNGYMSGLPDDLRKRADYADRLSDLINDRHREEWGFQKELLPYDDVVSLAKQFKDDWLRASHAGVPDEQVRLLEQSYDSIQKVVDMRSQLNTGTPDKVIAVRRLGVGRRDGIEMNAIPGMTGKYRADDGTVWSVAMEGQRTVENPHVITSEHHEMFNGLVSNRIARALDGRIPEVRVAYINGVPHLLERQATRAAASTETNPLINAWAKDSIAAHDHEGTLSGGGPAMREVLSTASSAEAKRYIDDLSDAYDNNKDALYRIIEESGLGADAQARVKARAASQMSWLLSTGGGIAALTAGAAVARASTGGEAQGNDTGPSYEIRRSGRPTDRKLEIVGSDGSHQVLSASDMQNWVDSHMPPGFTDGGLINPSTPFALKTGLPSPAEIDSNALYVVRPSELVDRGIIGNEIHPEHTASIGEARAAGKRLPPLRIDVTPEGKLYLEDGNHRLDFAARNNDPIAVKLRKVSAESGWEPQASARDITPRLKELLPDEPAPTSLGRMAEGTGPISRTAELQPEFAGSEQTTKPGVIRDEFRLPDPEPPTELEKLLQGTKARLDDGTPMSQIGRESPAREAYVRDKAATRERQANEFRAAAQARRVASTASPEAETDLERALRGTNDRLGKGESMREIRATAPAEMHPLAVQRLEMAHDAALERAVSAPDAATRSEAIREAKTIERELTKVGARPGAVEDVAAMATVTNKLEKTAADMVDAVGPTAPSAAQKAAAGYRAAEGAADRKTMARTARAADAQADAATEAPQSRTSKRGAMAAAQVITDPATGQRRLVHPETGEVSEPIAAGKDRTPGPGGKARIDDARNANLRADVDLANARVAEGKAKIEARGATQAVRDARTAAAAKSAGAASPPAKSGSLASKLVTAAKVAGAASELGVPGVPSVHDIPVIGPLLSAYIKYRTLKAVTGRFVGRVPATADSRAAALAAKTKDALAHAVDRSLGLVERNKGVIRTAMVAASVRAGDALKRRAFDDGLPDAPKNATPSELAAARMREVAAVATNPELITKMVRAQMRDVIDPDLITATENHLIAMFKHLNDTAPKGPPPNPYAMKPWQPSPAAALQWARRLAVANDPRAALDALETQTLTPEAADTMRVVYDKLFAAAQQRLIQRATDLKNPVPYRQRLQNSLLFDVALDASLDPINAMILSQAHTTSGSASPPAGLMPSGPGPAAPSAPPVPSIANATNLSSIYQQTTADRPGMR